MSPTVPVRVTLTATVIELAIGSVNDVLLKTMLWGALWDSVREAELNPNDFVALALKTLPTENDEELTQTLLGRAGTAFQRYLSAQRQAAIAPQFEALCFDRIREQNFITQMGRCNHCFLH